MAVEYRSYLIRIWRETEADLISAGEWHGEVEYIQSGRCWKFKSVEPFLDLIKMKEHDIAPIKSPAS